MRSCRFYGSVPGVSRHFSAALADTLLRIAEEEAYRPHWLADVLAAAVAGGCEVLVTFNLEAFPEEYRCEPSRLGCLSPRHCGAELRKHPTLRSIAGCETLGCRMSGVCGVLGPQSQEPPAFLGSSCRSRSWPVGWCRIEAVRPPEPYRTGVWGSAQTPGVPRARVRSFHACGCLVELGDPGSGRRGGGGR